MCIRDRLQTLRITSERDLPALLRAADPALRFQQGTIGYCRTEQGGLSPVIPAINTGSSSARFWGVHNP
eukprot:6549064-Prorocentrum_lima.AAC.1